ncbi:MerR family transcriptional regulator [bacterium]|nr:MerR family transcriptional regulator [bacterium]
MSPTGPFSIGEAINLLKDEFPTVTVSKLRFLEGEGLVRPARSTSGYREFGTDDVERVRYILRQQRDHFLPLKVIKSKLTAWERGEEPTVDGAPGAPPETYFASSGVSMDADELARAAGVTTDLITSLVRHGVIEPDDDGTTFDEDDLAIARAAGRLAARGLEARHLRAMRLSANREIDLLTQLTGPLLRHRSPASRKEAAEILADCAQAAGDVQDAIVRSQLRDLLES